MNESYEMRAAGAAASRTGIPVRLPGARVFWWLAVAAALAWALARAGLFQRALVNPGGRVLFERFWRAALAPELNPDFLGLVFSETLVTLAYAVSGTALSLAIGLAGGVLASQAWWRAGHRAHRAPWLAVRAGLAFPRATHEVIWGLFLVNILGLDPLVAILSIAIPFGAITAKVFSEIFDETPRGPFQALLASGASPLRAFCYSLLPQAMPGLLSYAFYRFECSIRSAAVLGVIGAGGLGYQLLLSFQSLRYAEMWTLIGALILLNGVTDLWSGLVRRELGEEARARTPGRGVEVHERRHRLVKLSLAAALIATPLSFWFVGADLTSLWAPRTFGLLAEVVTRSVPPAMEAALLGELLGQTLQTLAISILAIALAGLGGLLLAFPAARTLAPGRSRREVWRRAPGWVVYGAARAVLLICRAVPASVWALVLLFVFFPGVLPGALALGMYTLGVLGRLMAEVVEALDERPLRALRALGASEAKVFAYGVLPRALPGFVVYGLYRWEVATRETLVVGVVGAAGLGRALNEHLSRFDYPAVLTTLLCFFILTLAVDLAGAAARRSLR